MVSLQNPVVTFTSFYFADWCEGDLGDVQESFSHTGSGDSRNICDLYISKILY